MFANFLTRATLCLKKKSLVSDASILLAKSKNRKHNKLFTAVLQFSKQAKKNFETTNKTSKNYRTSITAEEHGRITRQKHVRTGKEGKLINQRPRGRNRVITAGKFENDRCQRRRWLLVVGRCNQRRRLRSGARKC